jgi:hypothetical protein
MNAKLHIAHHVPGRLRVKVASAKGNSELLDQMKRLFDETPGVHGIAVNPATGSLILHYDPTQQAEFYNHFKARYARHALPVSTLPSNEIDNIVNTIQGEAEFFAERSLMVRTIVALFKSIDQQVRVATDNTIDLKIVAAVGFAGLALMEIGVTAATPMWVTLAIFALNHLAELNLPDTAHAA